MQEYFKDIDGYEGLYQISNFGNVKSLAKGDGNGNRERLLRQENMVRNTTVYKRVSLSAKGKVKRFSVHRLVGKMFIDNPEQKPMINHIDNNGSNNHVSNLEWCTHSENMLHSQKQGRQFNNKSKAGKAAGVVRRAKMMKEIEADIGLKIGKRTIDGYYGRKGKKQNHCVQVTCECGSVDILDYRAFKQGKLLMCKSCALRLAHQRKKEK